MICKLRTYRGRHTEQLGRHGEALKQLQAIEFLDSGWDRVERIQGLQAQLASWLRRCARAHQEEDLELFPVLRGFIALWLRILASSCLKPDVEEQLRTSREVREAKTASGIAEAALKLLD